MKTKVHEITFEKLNLERIHEIVSRPEKLVLSEKTKEKILQGRNYLDEKIKKSKTPVYGVTTGFGSLYDKNISKKERKKILDIVGSSVIETPKSVRSGEVNHKLYCR